MANEKNLIPNSERTPEELRKIAAAGGRASGAARRRKKSLKEAADLYLSLEVTDRRIWNKLSRDGVDPEDIDNQMAIIVGLSDSAKKGDSKAAKLLFDLLDEGTSDSEKIGYGMQALADILRNPVPNRNLEDFEE